jgi:hypothetical protein
MPSTWRKLLATPAYASIRQHTSAYVSIRQHTSAYVSTRRDMGEALNDAYTCVKKRSHSHAPPHVSVSIQAHKHHMLYKNKKRQCVRANCPHVNDRPTWQPVKI